MLRFKHFFIFFFLGVFAPALAMAASDLALQRGQFVEAEQALKNGNLAKFEKLKAKLQDYPLYPYLIHGYLAGHLSNAKKEEIDRFLAEYGDSLPGEKLRRDWLRFLAMRQHWQDYLGYYTSLPDVETQCEYRRALLSVSNSTLAFEDLDRLWLTEHKQPAACDPLFSAWQRAGGLTRDKVWQRYQIAMGARQTTTARHLEKYLDAKDKHLAALWQQVDQKPRLIFTSRELKKDEPLQRAIVLHGIARIAHKDVFQATNAWNMLRSQLSFTEEEQAAIESKLTTISALRNVYRPPEQLVSLNPALADQKAREWRIRTALASEEWDTALIWMNHMDENSRDSSQWQYWRARALETQGSPRAREIYDDLSQLRNYYGFLAADRLGMAYQLNDQPLFPPETDLASMQQNPGIMRARELYLIGRTPDARREWNHTIRNMSDTQKAIAAKLAQQWGWHDRAIMTVERSAYNNDLTLRFPIPYDDQVLAEAEKRNIDPAWAFAMMRQESVFMTDARSPVGALGLMQLMPNTGRLVARSLNSRLPNSRSLLDANTNIRFGITYLRSVLNNFNDNPVLATAAYNAGGDRVKRWLPYNRALPADVWVETVPFSETRNYLQNVFAYTVVYDYRLGRSMPKSLAERMPSIQGHGTSSLQHTSSLIGDPGT